MRLSLLMVIVLLVFFSGCTQSGQVTEREIEEPPNLTESKVVAEETTEEPDPCAGIGCGETITTCPDGFVSTCINPCDLGECLPCKPDCSEHDIEEKKTAIASSRCEIECDECEDIDIDKCECIKKTFCDGNGVCEKGEYPESKDCPDCDDDNPDTNDFYDYGLISCVNEPQYFCGDEECNEDEDEENCPEDCLEEYPGDVRISQINFDAPGDDRKKENWNGEWVEIEGYGVDITDWTIEDEANHNYAFPFFIINGKIKLHSGDGEDNMTDLYWSCCAIWNNDGDTAVLKDNHGDVIDSFSY
jgi:hypothetical protein